LPALQPSSCLHQHVSRDSPALIDMNIWCPAFLCCCCCCCCCRRQVSRLQRERDEARQAKDHALVERDVALQQVWAATIQQSQLLSQPSASRNTLMRLSPAAHVVACCASQAADQAAGLGCQQPQAQSCPQQITLSSNSCSRRIHRPQLPRLACCHTACV
jgi:hypothetical protein